MTDSSSVGGVGPSDFEDLVAEIWERAGWDTTVTTDRGDGGYDIIANRQEPIEETHLIEVKRYRDGGTVGRPTVQRLAGAVKQEGGDKGVLVATTTFSDPAEEAAEPLGIGLVDRAALLDLIEAHDLVPRMERLAERHSDFPLPESTANANRKDEVREALEALDECTSPTGGFIRIQLRGSRSIEVFGNTWNVVTATQEEFENAASFKTGHNRFSVSSDEELGSVTINIDGPSKEFWVNFHLKFLGVGLEEIFGADWQDIESVQKQI